MSAAAALSALFLMGLLGSLHCLGMCGPILLSLARLGPSEPSRHPGRVWIEQGAYHAGRLWTYGLLGLVAGFAGERLRAGASWVGLQRLAGLGLAALVVVAGLLLLASGARTPAGAALGTRLGCAVAGSRGPLAALRAGRGIASRLLLGALLGLLPCGLVYAALAACAAGTKSPLASALGMLAFGAGTLPALGALLATSRLLPLGLRATGPRIAALLLILVGSALLARAALVSPERACPACEAPPGTR